MPQGDSPEAIVAREVVYAFVLLIPKDQLTTEV
jgi:hypothetical protein